MLTLSAVQVIVAFLSVTSTYSYLNCLGELPFGGYSEKLMRTH